MNRRHAAALAILGWYLIMPHTIQGTTSNDLGLPVSQWYFYNERKVPDPGAWKTTRQYALVFATEEQCKQALAFHIDFVRKFNRITRGMDETDRVVMWENSRCISQDDPRLNSK